MSYSHNADEYPNDGSRDSYSFAFALTAAFLLVTGFSTFHHEIWRDEMQAWLLARDSPSLLALVRNARYEGHPLLWFMILWPFARLTHRPEAMQFANLLISGGAVFLIGLFAPAPRWIRALAAFGYFCVYEYGTIARNYSLGILLLVALCAVFPRRKAHCLLAGTILALAANSSSHALILAIAVLVSLVVEAIEQPAKAGLRALSWIGFAIALSGIVMAIWQIWPPPDRG